MGNAEYMGNQKAKMVRYQLRNFSKTSKTPRRAYDKERLDSELKMIGTCGLKNKREIWRNGLILSKVRAVARNLLTMDEKDPRRIFEGQALMRRMIRYGILDRTSSVSITFSPLRLRISSSVVSRLSCSPVVLPRASTTPVFSSSRGTFVSDTRSSTFHLSWFASSPSLTSSSPTPHHSVVDAQAASRGRPQPAVAVMRMTSIRYAPTRVITHISAFKK